MIGVSVEAAQVSSMTSNSRKWQILAYYFTLIYNTLNCDDLNAEHNNLMCSY